MEIPLAMTYVIYTTTTSEVKNYHDHGLRTPREEIAFTARPKIQSQSQIFRYGGSIFCLPHRPNFSDIFDLCLHWVSVVRDHDHVITHDICNNFIEIKFSVGCMVCPWLHLFQHQLPVKLLIRYKDINYVISKSAIIRSHVQTKSDPN